MKRDYNGDTVEDQINRNIWMLQSARVYSTNGMKFHVWKLPTFRSKNLISLTSLLYKNSINEITGYVVMKNTSYKQSK
jgi:hypothetical protein